MEYENYVVVAEETYGNANPGLRKSYISTGTGLRNVLHIQREIQISPWLSFFRSFVTEAFLPVGFPHSVSPDYLSFQIWDSLQAFCSSLSGCLSTQAVLKGVGVGDQTATVASATITWMLKDGSGMIGRIVFAWMQGAELDCNSKKWRLFADVVNDIAMFLDLVSPYYPVYFTPIVCTSGVLKALVGVAGGATRAALTQHQARKNNMADVSAKDGSQETMINLMGLLFNLLLIPLVANNAVLIWLLFAIFTVLHLACNFMAVSAVSMESLNLERYQILLKHYFKNNDSIMSVEDVNHRESVWFKMRSGPVKIHLGVALDRFITSVEDLSFYRTVYKDCKYLLGTTHEKNGVHIWIALQNDADAKSLLEAVYQAIVIQTVISENLNSLQTIGFNSWTNLQTVCFSGERERVAFLSRQMTADDFDNFLNKVLQTGWITSHVLFAPDEYRFKWQ